MNFNILTLFFLLITGSAAFSQNGFIKGQVGDGITNELIPGVKVTVDGLQKGNMTDLDGVFFLGNMAPGTYTITITYPTYKTKSITDIIVNAGDTTFVRVALEKEVKEVGAVTVKGQVSKESNENIIKMQRNSATVVDGISQESIKKSPDSKASDVLKRVSGASVQDNKFVVVRGLSDRYNFALINGASLPSSESDRKAFSFDIFPSNMLDNLVIIKTATPDLPGEFAGGVIDINTTETKAKSFHNIQIGGGFNTLTTFKDFRSTDGGSLDFLGLGAGSRGIPGDIPATETFAELTKDDKAVLAEKMDFGWSAKNGKALPNGSLQYSLGRIIPIGEKKRDLGLVFAYSYQNNNSMNMVTRREFEEQATEVVQKMELKDSVFSKNIMNSAMLNLSFKINDKNKISYKNMYSITSEDKVNIRRGVREMDNDPRQWERSTNIWYTQNNLYTSQLIGNHELKKGKFNWNTGFSSVQRDIPNLRRVVYRKYSLTENDSNERYVAVVQNNGTIPTAAGNMFWSTSNERIFSAKYDYALPVNFGKLKNEFKIGGMHQYRDRDFVSRNFGFSQYKPTGSSFNSQLLLLPENEIFAPENLGLLDNGQGGFKLEEASSVDDSYQAEAFLHAGFLMIDSKIGEKEKFRIVGGTRLESYNQRFHYVEFGSNLQRDIDTTVNDILPSVNLIYSITPKMNVRTSYYRTVSRPEFRELAPFAFYNFVQDNILSGNPALQRALIDNYDVRFEIFPGAGQVFSISGFYKSFTNPIELINRTGTSGAPELYYSNVPKVTNFGTELEYRLKLGFINKAKDSTFLDGTTFYTNLSLIKSRVDLSDFAGAGEERPLQGQSPYIVNAGLMYNSFKGDWSASVSYNVVGQRIYIVGNVQEPSVWENGRHVIDFQISKIIEEKLEIKLNVKDMLAQDLIFFQDLNGNQKYDDGTDNNWQEITFGQTVSLSLKYNF